MNKSPNIFKKIYWLIITLSLSSQVFASRSESSPQEIFLLPLIFIGALILLKFSELVEKYTQHMNVVLKIGIKGICFILFISVVAIIISGVGLIFEYIPKKWSMLF